MNIFKWKFELISVVAFLAILAVVFLFIAIVGRPPYVFYGSLKLVVLLSGIGLTSYFVSLKKYHWLAFFVAIITLIHILAAMKREEWLLWNLAGIIVWLISIRLVWNEYYGHRQK